MDAITVLKPNACPFPSCSTGPADARFLKRSEVEEQYGGGSWQRKVFAEFEATLTSKVRPFPCVFGVSGFERDELRYVFLETITGRALAVPLECYIAQARGFGSHTSLVVFSRPAPVLSVKDYHNRFWSVLRNLSNADSDPWPSDIPHTVDDARWEFCFAGEPLFVVCNTPAHVARQSRRASAMTMTFQPRWVFDGILGKQSLAERAVGAVRARLKPYDHIAAASSLGLYGDPNNREAAQYFLSDDAEPMGCPFKHLREEQR